jgi:5-methylcytosine-specific restriction protein A
MNLGDFLARQIADRLGLPVRVENRDSVWSVAITGLEVNDSFTIEFRKEWRSAHAILVWGKFARPCIQKLGEADPVGRSSVAALALALPKGIRVQFRVNGVEHPLSDPSVWPNAWNSVHLALLRGSLPSDTMTDHDWQVVAADLVLPLLSMLLALLDAEDVESDTSAWEGSSYEVLSTRYERKQVNRDICLRIRGIRCLCCNRSMEEEYGSVARDLIEVHHVTPASAMGSQCRVNPTTDLIPVCPNCHRVLHKSDPPMLPEHLRATLESLRARRA